MFTRVRLAIVLVGLVAFSGTAVAHHGGATEYDASKTVGPISGTVTRFNMTYPHPQLYFDVKGASGTAEQWAVLVRPTPAILRKHGWTKATLKPGDAITVTMTPHRTAPRMGNCMRLIVNGKLVSENVIAMTNENALAPAAGPTRP